MTSRPESDEDIVVEAVPVEAVLVADERLLAAHDLARAALVEITPAATVGDPVGYTLEPSGVVSLRFENHLTGYPGWFWTVSLARVEDADPTVLEVELLPGEGALVAPDWVPWAVRLADYHAQQHAAAEASALLLAEDANDADDLDDDDLEDEDLADLEDELDDVDDLDALDFDGDGSPILHSGDVDGVDIDELADDADLDDDDLDGDDLDDDDLNDEDDVEDEEDGMNGSDLPDRDGISDEDFVSDEDDLGEEELQDPEKPGDDAVEYGDVLRGER